VRIVIALGSDPFSNAHIRANPAGVKLLPRTGGVGDSCGVCCE